MIHAFGRPDAPVPRLMAALAARGHRVGGPGTGATPEVSSSARAAEAATLVLGAGTSIQPLALAALLGAWRSAAGARVLVLSALGVHPDARQPRLRALWLLEEGARASDLPTLTLRLAPLVGPESPFWLRLRSRPRLPRRGADLLQPVLESDVVETLDRALHGRAAWSGWFEIAGPDVWSLGELAELARRAGPVPAGAGQWEPPHGELAEHRLAEIEPWASHFALTPGRVADAVAQWAA